MFRDAKPGSEREVGLFMVYERGYILYKVGTVKELAQFECMMNGDLYREALRIVRILDGIYGADRDVEKDDGGFVLIAENIQDIELVSQRYMRLDGDTHEAVDVLKFKSGLYVNAFFLCNNEFGINILMPIGVAPSALLRDLHEKVR
jgi:hypothetical protein